MDPPPPPPPQGLLSTPATARTRPPSGPATNTRSSARRQERHLTRTLGTPLSAMSPRGDVPRTRTSRRGETPVLIYTDSPTSPPRTATPRRPQTATLRDRLETLRPNQASTDLSREVGPAKSVSGEKAKRPHKQAQAAGGTSAKAPKRKQPREMTNFMHPSLK